MNMTSAMKIRCNPVRRSMAEGLDPELTHLWAQVRRAGARHGHDPEGDFLRDSRHPSTKGVVMLGDVAECLILAFGPHQIPHLLEPPKFDEQRWILEVRDSEIRMEIRSRPYWGLGMFSACYLNEIIIEGPLKRRCRLILDLMAGLGKPPWEAVRRSRFSKHIGISSKEHQHQWEAHLSVAQSHLRESIEMAKDRLRIARQILAEQGGEEFDISRAEQGLKLADDDVEIAERALHDRNTLAVERALDRVELSVLESHPDFGKEFDVLENVEEEEPATLVEALQAKGEIISIPQEGKAISDIDEDLPLVDLTGAGEQE